MTSWPCPVMVKNLYSLIMSPADFIPELLAPANSVEALNAACGEGADAVYLSLNARSSFTYPQCEGALRSLQRMGRKLYVRVNTVFEEREADRFYQLLKYLAALGPDGIMVQDFGIAGMARENFPSLKLLALSQMNIASRRAVNLFSRSGFSRAALAPELSLEEIQDIRGNTNMALEVLVHGALCVSISGLCLFSSYLGGKSANRGICTQACRRHYLSEGDVEGAYYFSPNDLQLIEKIPELAGMGVNSFRIEGRMKGAEYVARAVSAYRLVLDKLGSGEAALQGAIKKALEILDSDFKNKRYPPVIPKDISFFRRSPGRDKAPPTGPPRREKPELGEGLYAQVSAIEDLYVLQTERPEKVILCYNNKLLSRLSGTLPFGPRDLIIHLDPFFPQNQEEELAEDIYALLEKGFTQFVINNPGHFSFFRNAGDRLVTLIAGPWLYAFNSWSLAFLASHGADYFISPLENNRQNMERTFHNSRRDLSQSRRSAFITVYSRPRLFQIRANLGYGFGRFTSSQDEVFRLVSSPKGGSATSQGSSLVFPEKFFYLGDKIPFLREAGFRRFILDFSSGPVKKTDYKEIMRAIKKAAPPVKVSRFNWKNGFFQT